MAHASPFLTFADRFHAHFTRDPNSRVNLGIDRDLGELPDPSLRGKAAQVTEAEALLAEARAVGRDDLGFDPNLDLDLAILALKREIHDLTYTFNGRTTAQQMPTAGDDIGDGLFMLFMADPRPVGDRLDDITARLEAIPAYLHGLLGRLDTPITRWVAIDLDKVRGLPSLFETLSGWAAQEAWPGVERLAEARARGEAALSAYADALEALPTTPSFHLDEDTARQLVALRGLSPSLEEIHGFARRFLRQNAESVEVLRARLIPKYDLPDDTTAAQLQAFFNERFAVTLGADGVSSVLERYQEERARILDFIGARDLFPIPEAQDMKILQTPAFMASTIPAGAMMPPAPFREGVRTSLVYLTLSEALLDEHTELGIPTMMIHEGIPGHHLQLATASMHPSIIRRHYEAMEHAEGWTTMLEDYMLDMGYMGELTDEARFIGRRDIARIGARVAIDLFFMTGQRHWLDVGVDADIAAEDPFEAAGNLLIKVTGFTPGRVQAELNWYSQQRGYPLSYLTGNTLVWDLKREVAEQNKGRLEGLELDRAFHRVYLEAGNMPLSYLRRVFAHVGLLA